MGYSYDASGKLCCDICDDSGGVRKYRCPFGWCQPIALCPKCKHEHPEYTSKEWHREHGCEKAMIQVKQEETKKQQMLAAGKLLRCAALWHPDRKDRKVKVIFRNGDKETAYWMARRTYDAIALGVLATVDDFKKHGKVTKARNVDIYSPI
jgi:hypothetical protein